MLYLCTTHRENYYGLFRVPGTVGQMVVSVLNRIALDKTVDPVSKRMCYWPAFAILFVLLNVTALLLYVYLLPRAMRPPRSLLRSERAVDCDCADELGRPQPHERPAAAGGLHRESACDRLRL